VSKIVSTLKYKVLLITLFLTTKFKFKMALTIDRPTLVRRMLVGGGIGLALISFFLFTAGEPNPEWGAFWRIRPLVIVPLAGAAGGVFSYLMEPFRQRGGWRMILAVIASVLVFLIGLWMGTVLGLDGTYWN
jgi:hypothetical protein